jgi:hypothetical protein
MILHSPASLITTLLPIDRKRTKGITLRLLTAKRISLPVLAVLLACGIPFCASEEPVAATLRAVTAMNSSSCQRPLVSFEGIVTHVRPSPNDFFVQQDGAGLYVENPTQTPVESFA